MTDVMQALTAQLSDRIAADTDGVLMAVLAKRGVVVTKENVQEFAGRGTCTFFPDQTEVYSWDGTPVLKLWPGKTRVVDGKLTYTQKYQEL